MKLVIKIVNLESKTAYRKILWNMLGLATECCNLWSRLFQ